MDRSLSAVRHNLVSTQFSSKHNLPIGRYPVGLENMLGNIKTDRGNLFHGWLSDVVTFDSHSMAPRRREWEPSTQSPPLIQFWTNRLNENGVR